MANVKPRATNEISDNNGNNNKPNDLIGVHEQVLGDYLLISGLILVAHQVVQQLIESAYIYQLDQPG
jgi:hypothetical protein